MGELLANAFKGLLNIQAYTTFLGMALDPLDVTMGTMGEAMPFYGIELTEEDAQALQPERVRTQLKPHQRAALQKALQMERGESISYHVENPQSHFLDKNRRALFTGAFEVQTNVGILGDIVGYGKTLTALSIIAQQPTTVIQQPKQKVFTYMSRCYGSMQFSLPNTTFFPTDAFLQTTLVVVPRGPVYDQWAKSIARDTAMKPLLLDSLRAIKRLLPDPRTATWEEVKRFVEGFDLVLIKNTTLPQLVHHYPHLPAFYAWNRIVIDEAHEVAAKMPAMEYRFVWLVTSSYRMFLTQLNRCKTYQTMLSTMRSLVDQERILYTLVKGEETFVRGSFSVPQPSVHHYICKSSMAVSLLHSYVSAQVQTRLNVGDLAGAIRELGGSEETEEALADLVTQDLQRAIHNKQAEVRYITDMHTEEDSRALRLVTLNQELQRLEERLRSLTNRLTHLKTDTCSCCMEPMESPVVLSCTHVMCAKCLLQWFQTNARNRSERVVCPECRAPIDSSQLIAVVKERAHAPVPRLLSKEAQLMDILKNKPNGSFLVFSRYDGMFGSLSAKMVQEGIAHAEIKGTTGHMMRLLNDFKDGRIQVILLNVYHAGCGIDLSFATDVVLYHTMENEMEQAIGRAQRVGRSNTLRIHHLLFPHECNEEAVVVGEVGPLR